MKLKQLYCSVTIALSALALPTNANLVEQAQNWQTFETAHFRVHYTPEYKQWALSSAREMEEVRTLIKQQQGRVLDEKVDAYIVDPFNAANGFAFPLSNKPFMALFATPPLSDGVVANSTSWQQLLVLHEYVHLVHLGQKTRSPWRNQVAKWFDLYDAIQINDERWVSEGYATLLESKLSGRGRLYHSGVEAILQQFAREGALPSYQQLSEVNDNYLSGSMAYLVGVRYLKWLEENYSEETLDAVWTRWSAVKNRDFDEAFQGVFQDSAQHLYQRFVAEYTYQAMQNEANFSESKSKLWLDLAGKVNAPTLSPDGKHLAIVQKTKEGKVLLNVYSTEENVKAEKDFKEAVEALLKEDPQDIAAKAPNVFKRKTVYTLNQVNYRGINNPRWLNNSTIVYGAASTDSNNALHQDLFTWQLKTNKIEQLTNGENLRRFDISPQGDFIIAERNRYGYSQLVKVSMQGEILEELTEASLEHVYDFPRFRPQAKALINDTSINVSPISNSFAYLVSSLNKHWQLKVRNNGHDFIVPLPKDYQFISYPEWAKDGESLYFVASLNGQNKIYQYNFKDERLVSLTSGEHPVSWPVAQSNNQILLLSTNSKGPDVYQLNLDDALVQHIEQTTQSNQVTTDLASNYQLKPASMKAADESLGTTKPYGIGPQQGTFTIGESYYSASSSLFELGYKSDDVISRFSWQVNLSQDLFENALSGISGQVRWQGWPIKILAHGYKLNLKDYSYSLSRQKSEETGLFVEASYPMRFDTFKLSSLKVTPIAQAKIEQYDINIANFSTTDSQYLALGVKQSWLFEQQSWGVRQSANITYLSGTNTEDNSYSGTNSQFTLSAHISDYGLGFDYQNIARSSDAGNILSLGGYASTLMQPKAHLNKLLAPELNFNTRFANDYQKFEVFIPLDMGRIFYTRHDMAQQKHFDSYGIKGDMNLDFGFTGISNLTISYGLSQVTPENEKSETQGWLGLWHKW